jgi:hypothetical protein
MYIRPSDGTLNFLAHTKCVLLMKKPFAGTQNRSGGENTGVCTNRQQLARSIYLCSGSLSQASEVRQIHIDVI